MFISKTKCVLMVVVLLYDPLSGIPFASKANLRVGGKSHVASSCNLVKEVVVLNGNKP